MWGATGSPAMCSGPSGLPTLYDELVVITVVILQPFLKAVKLWVLYIMGCIFSTYRCKTNND